MSDSDKNQALAVVIEKLTEIVGNISQEEIIEEKRKLPENNAVDSKTMEGRAKDNSDINSSLPDSAVKDSSTGVVCGDPVKDFEGTPDTSETIEISVEEGGSPNQIVINLPVKVGNVSITNTEGLLKSLKQLDQGMEMAKERKDDGTDVKSMYRCSKCDYSSHNKHYLKQHFDLVHTAQRPFKCPLCDYAGKRSHSLKEHLVVHSPFRPFMCSFCSASFRKKGHLTNHIKLHASEQAVACPICKHYIANHSELSRHLRQVHVDDQVFLCHVCDYATTSESNIIRHMHTHGNQTVYSCSDCRFIGVHEEVLKKHVQTYHDGEGSFTVSTSTCSTKCGPVVLLKCSECGFTTREREMMKEHMYERHLIYLANQPPSENVLMSDKLGRKPDLAQMSSDTSQAPRSSQISEKRNSSPHTSEEGSQNTAVIDTLDNDQLNTNHDGLISIERKKEPTDGSASQSENISVSDEEMQPSQEGETSKWNRAMILKVENVDGDQKSEQTLYLCTNCKYQCTESVQFISHMLSHGSREASEVDSLVTAENEQLEEKRITASFQDTSDECLMREKSDGLYCCLICGYACSHQRTIKSHIWKHSGHKDINYPSFQNGPLSVYEVTSNSADVTELTATPAKSKMAAVTTNINSQAAVRSEDMTACHMGSKTQSDPEILKNENVIQSTEVISKSNIVAAKSMRVELNRKRKSVDDKPSEIDVSMPKLRILSSQGTSLVVGSQTTNCQQAVGLGRISSDECTASNKNNDGHVVLPDKECHSESSITRNKPSEDVNMASEEVIESEGVIEVVADECYSKSGCDCRGDGKELDRCSVEQGDSDSVKESCLQINEQGISSSLLAVIEHFRKGCLPGRDNSNRPRYEKVSNFYVCSVCQHESSSIAGIQSHLRSHNLHPTTDKSPRCGNEKEQIVLIQECKASISNAEDVNALLESCDGQQVECVEAVSEDAVHFICENCEKSFPTVEKLLDHKMKVVCWSKSAGSGAGSLEEKSCFKCNFCDFVGMSVRSVKSHMKRHWNDLRAKHNTNKGNCFTDTGNARKFFVCERCTSVFGNILDLLAHNSSSCLPVQIPKFNKSNSNSSNVKHLKKPADFDLSHDKMYKCEMCNFVSKSYHKMDSHVKKHIEPCHLRCNLCSFMATSVRSLKSHMKRHRNDERFVRQPLEQYKCNMCGYICHHLPALKSHMWRHASESNYSYEKTNAVINAAIEDSTQSSELNEPVSDAADGEKQLESAEYSTVARKSDISDSLIAFRCCHCFYETCIKKELNEHMKQHMDIIQKTIEVNNELFCKKLTKETICTEEHIYNN